MYTFENDIFLVALLIYQTHLLSCSVPQDFTSGDDIFIRTLLPSDIGCIWSKKDETMEGGRSFSISSVAPSHWCYCFMLDFSWNQGQHWSCNSSQHLSNSINTLCPLIMSRSDVYFLLGPCYIVIPYKKVWPLLPTPQIEGLQWTLVS